MADDHSQSQASFLPCTGYSPVTSLQIQSLLRLTPAGRGDLTFRVTTHTVTGTGFDLLPDLGVFSHCLCLRRRLAGLAIMRVTHLGVWLPPLSGIRPDPLAQVQGAPYPSLALLRVPRLLHACPISYTGAFVSERTMGPLPVCHTDIGCSASGLWHESLP